MKKLILNIIFLIIFSYSGFGENSNWSYYLFGNYGLNFHSADFYKLPQTLSCCPGYSSGYGLGFNAGFGFEYNLKNNAFIGISSNYQNNNGLLKKLENNFVIINLEEIPGTIEHSIETKLKLIGISPYFGYKFSENFNFKGGFNIGYIFNSWFEQKEQITQPVNTGYFKDTKSRIRNVFSGEIKDMNNIQFGLFLNFSYDLKLNPNKTLMLCPHVNFEYYSTNFVRNSSWNGINLFAGVSLKFNPADQYKVYKQIYKIDTVKYIDDILTENFKFGIMEKKISEIDFKDSIVELTEFFRTDTVFKPKSKSEKIKKEITDFSEEKVEKKQEISEKLEEITINSENQMETTFLDLFDISDKENSKSDLQAFYIKGKKINKTSNFLNYIFFELNSDEIHQRYFAKNSFFDIIAQNLNYYDKIIICGYIDPKTENDNCNLAEKRALKIRNYFTNKFNIDQDRIIIQNNEKKCSPKILSKANDNRAFEENRRVEIFYRKKDFNEVTLKSEILENGKIFPNEIFIKLNKELNNSKIIIFEDTISIDKNKEKIRIKLDDKLIEKAFFKNEFSIKIIGVDVTNQLISLEKKYPIIKNNSEQEIEKLEILWTDFKEEKISNTIKNNIISFLSKLNDDYLISIRGNMDLLGQSLTSSVVMDNRLSTIEKFIKQNKPKNKIISGGYNLISNEEISEKFGNFPEFRFFYRSIIIQAIKYKNVKID